LLILREFISSLSDNTKKYISVIFIWSFIICHCYLVGDDPSKNPLLFYFYFSMTIFLIFYTIIISVIRKGLRYTSSIWIRDDIDGAWDRSFKFAIKLNKFLYFSSSWIHVLTYLVIYPLAKHYDMGGFYTSTIICFLFLEYIVRQLSLNWMWKNLKGTQWKFSIYDQFSLILRYLFIAPLFVFSIYFMEFKIYHIKETFLKSSDPSGWGWYIFTFFGIILLLGGLKLIYLSLTRPEETWQMTLDAIYDDEAPRF